MVLAMFFILLIAVLVAKMVWDVQKIKKARTEVERLQYLAGIEAPKLDIPVVFIDETIVVEKPITETTDQKIPTE